MLLALLGVGLLFLMCNDAVLFVVNWDLSAVRPRGFQVMNPFWDRGPERGAEAFLWRLAAGDFREWERIPGSQFVEKERRWRIMAWRVGGRSGGSLMYWVRRGGGYGEVEESVWIEVGQDGSVKEFEAVY